MRSDHCKLVHFFFSLSAKRFVQMPAQCKPTVQHYGPLTKSFAGAIAGIVVASVVAAVALLAIAVLAYRYQSSNRKYAAMMKQANDGRLTAERGNVPC